MRRTPVIEVTLQKDGTWEPVIAESFFGANDMDTLDDLECLPVEQAPVLAEDGVRTLSVFASDGTHWVRWDDLEAVSDPAP